ncbi:MAG: hypothetical protein DCC75_08785 [Proteobacteria bacterium]|nr:MAG: hypothetical protein DCC75_08785 [Pseudomonadota bacterium]
MLATVALRPHLIFGPGDNHLAPTILNRARAGRLLRVGDGKNLSDFTFIDDCIDAHLCALKALESGGEVGGRAYFISQSDPVPLWGWIDTLLELNGAPPVARAVSKRSALAIAGVMEIVSKLFGTQPLFTRFLICEMTTHHYFDISAARDQLGFQPKYGVIEALRATYKEGPKEGLRSCG